MKHLNIKELCNTQLQLMDDVREIYVANVKENPNTQTYAESIMTSYRSISFRFHARESSRDAGNSYITSEVT